jgi:dihydrodipicolinate synthase/N-acetylneuraminate lyase
MGLAPVIGFLYTQGANVLAPSLDELVALVERQMTTSVTENPRGVVVSIGTGDTLTLTLDDHLTVVDHAQEPSVS